jgi:hypothetical protein
MRVVRLAVVASLLALIALGCAREERRRIAAPDPSPGSDPEPGVTEARWIEGSDLARAVSAAASSPLVQQAYLEKADSRLRFESRYAIQAAGVTSDGSRVRVTVLPYSLEEDPRYATVTALIERDGSTLAQVSELIVGREPTSLEEGYSRTESAGGPVWIRDGAEYLVDAAGAPGADGASPAAERRRFDRGAFTRCFATQGPALCSAGVQTCTSVAPQFPYCHAVGCGAGMAVAAIYCGVKAFN